MTNIPVTQEEANKLAHIVATAPHFGTDGWGVMSQMARRTYEALPAGYARHDKDSCDVCGPWFWIHQ